MKLEVGKYYRTRDGRKAGPLYNYSECFSAIVEGDKGSGLTGRLFSVSGSHKYGETNFDLVAEWEDEMKITMDGKYAYRKDIYTQVRVLCIDRPGHVSDPVCSMDPVTGFIYCHAKDGSHNTASFDLVPLQEKLSEVWVNVYPDGTVYLYTDEGLAKRNCGVSSLGRTIKYIPAPDQTS